MTSSPPPTFTDGDVQVAVRALLGDADARVLGWHAEGMDWRIVSEVTGGLGRLRGLARQRGRDLPWSLVVKTSRPGGDAADGTDWEREWRAYTSGLLQPAGDVRPARLLHVTRPAEDRVTLWLEDVPDDTPEVWPLGRHVLMAGHLGTFNAAHPVAGKPPEWLWQDWLPSLDTRGDPALADPGDVWDEPLVRLAFPSPLTSELARVEAAFGRWSELLTALPRTLVHLDAGRFNVRSVIEDGRETTVLLDWQALGVGPVGTDLAMTHFLNLCRLYADPDEAEALDARGFAAYWEAVRVGDLGVGRPEVRFAYTAVSTMRAAIVTRLLLPRLAAADVDLRLWAEWGRKRGWTEREALRAWGRGLAFLLSLAGEADDLARHL